AAGVANMARWWNDMPQYEGIFDNQGRVRPDYYAFKFLSLIRGQNLPVTGTVPDIHAFAARGGRWVNVILWNFPRAGQGNRTKSRYSFHSKKTVSSGLSG
ncbi:MAG TPA: hypothetical protein VEU11_01120, partial [Terriglobales bacterium]|nr:hypothetical protein [Terriglobales bacterium]